MVDASIWALPGLESLSVVFDDKLSFKNPQAKHVLLILQVMVWGLLLHGLATHIALSLATLPFGRAY